MRIQKILSQYRREFRAIYECEHCNHIEESNGYDDSYFHNTVVPNKICKNCGKKAGKEYRPFATKYADSVVI